MRPRHDSVALYSLLVLILVVVAATNSFAQFREVPAEQTGSDSSQDGLVPTSQPFVTPRVAVAPTTVPPPVAAVVEEPTPEISAAPQPTPAVEHATQASAPEPVNDAAVISPENAQLEVRPLEAWSAFQTSGSHPARDKAVAPSPESTPAVVSFNQVEPGITTVAQLKEMWGEPSKSRDEGTCQVLIYAVPGFRQIDVRTDETGQTVQSMLVHLLASVSLKELEPRLGLDGVKPVDVPDEKGRVLGRGYPERGVLLTCADCEATKEITHISLETIRGDLFRLRAEYDVHNDYTVNLADLDEAICRNPEDAHAHWLRSELLSLIGRCPAALESVEQALVLDDDNPLYRLTRARLIAEQGQPDEALTETRAVADAIDTPEIVRARAAYQLGNLVAMGLEPDFQEALAHHMKAIDQAARHMSSPRADVRRMAKDILVDAHLAVAQDIALGDFQRQQEVVPKWLIKATELAEDFITNDQGDETLRMQIYRSTLAVYSILDGNFDSSVATEEALLEGRRLIAESDDRLYQHRVERELSETLFYAARVEHQRGQMEQALLHANNAVALLEGQADERQASTFDQIMTGQLYFLVGSLYALHHEDHEEAVAWYDKAQPMFDQEGLEDLVNCDSFGDLFVSMGVSYWETGDKDTAVRLTELGAELMQNAVQTGSLDLIAMSVPYGNLAAMYTDLGDQQQAKHYAAMLAKVENVDAGLKR